MTTAQIVKELRNNLPPSYAVEGVDRPYYCEVRVMKRNSGFFRELRIAKTHMDDFKLRRIAEALKNDELEFRQQKRTWP